jgi:predicted S18 family serine protease
VDYRMEGMWKRVAKTKTQEAAWELVRLLTAEIPGVSFVVVMRTPGGGCEVVPEGAFHPLDRELAARVVAKFAGRG